MTREGRGLVIVGAGGFGRETIDTYFAARDAGTVDADLLGVVDDRISEADALRLERLGVPYLGTQAELRERGTECVITVAIGAPRVRGAVSRAWMEDGYSLQTVIHPSATLGALSEIGEGSVVCAGAVISTDVRLGRGVHVNPNATIGHDAVLEDHVSVNPGAVISGNVTVESEALIGAGAVILQGLRVGSAAVVGAAACVTRSIAEGVTVKGVPAR